MMSDVPGASQTLPLLLIAVLPGSLAKNSEAKSLATLQSPNDGVFSIWEKYVNIPSEKYIYVHIYVCICVYTYLCKMDERRSYASLS